MGGIFFTQYFDTLSPKSNGECVVICPFPHDKGYETRPSAHVNLDKGVFHCKTCSAEGRFKDGGLSEIGFVAEVYNINYASAVQFMSKFEKHSIYTEDTWSMAQLALSQNKEPIEHLHHRGITDETIVRYKLGYTGNGIVYPVFINGLILDKRTYAVHREPGKPKIMSEPGASPLLFPFDDWAKDTRPTLLCAGENDTLLARQNGFNAVTSTFGEGSFPDIFLPMFNGKTIYICYDCDEAGHKGAAKTAFKLTEAGAMVYLVDLGLEGTKDDKDITDFFVHHGYPVSMFQTKLDEAKIYTPEMYAEERERRYPLVNLWDVQRGEYSNQYLSSRVMMMGKFELKHGPFTEVPTAIEYGCRGPVEGSAVCEDCPLRRENRLQGWWVLDETNLKKVLYMSEVTEEQQAKEIKKIIGIPQKCPGQCWRSVRERQSVMKVIFAPDVETEDELRGFRMVEQHAYVLSDNNRLEDGQRYRIYFRRVAHPQTQGVVLVVDRVEESDNNINSFVMTPKIVQELSQFQGDPKDVMNARYELAKRVVAQSAPRVVVDAMNIMYHSALDFSFAGKTMKGHPEGLIVGESRTGKSETARRLMQFYGLGTLTECKNASTAGFLGGADKSTSGGYRIRWGIIPRNNKGLVIGDELSGMSREVFSTLTGLRSEREAKLVKIVSGVAPAKTRLIWTSNTRVQTDGSSRPIALYPHGVKIVRDLIGSDEDIARFDFIVILPPNETYIPPFSKDELENLDNTPYRNLLYWVWSRRPEQVKFAEGVEQYVWQIAQELNDRFDSDVKIFGPEAHKKLARMAVSIGAMCFSHDGTGNNIVVRKEHVDFAADFVVSLYDNSIFRLADYARHHKEVTKTNEEVNTIFAQTAKAQPMLIRTLSDHMEIATNQLQILSGLDRDAFNEFISNMAQHGLIQSNGQNIITTLRFRKARDAYLNNIEKTQLIPLSQKGVL